MAPKSQTLFWTVLPKERTGSGTFVVSAFATTKLFPAAAVSTHKLKEFEMVRHWPQTVVNTSFTLKIDGMGLVNSTVVSEKPSQELWDLIFNNDTFVRGQEFKDYLNHRIRSFPAGHIMSRLAELYNNVAVTHPGQHPQPTDSLIDGLVSELELARVENQDVDQSKKKLYENWLTNNASRLNKLNIMSPRPTAGTPPSYFGANKTTFAFYQADQFYRRGMVNRTDGSAVDSPKRPDIDFHQIVASLGDYPVLLRRLGLIVDLEFSAPLHSATPYAFSVSPKYDVSFPPYHVATKPPRTRCIVQNGYFVAEPKEHSVVAAGQLNVANAREILHPNHFHNSRPSTGGNTGEFIDSEFDLMQVDVDGAALKAMDFGTNMGRVKSLETSQRYSAALPTLRSAGIALVRRDRGIDLGYEFAMAKIQHTKLSQSSSAELYADDLIRGYRVDIHDNISNQWFSLCRRDSKYSVGTNSPVMFEHSDEGYLKATTVTGSDSSDDLYIHERIATFDGWSLVAPRPGKTIVGHESGGQIDETVEVVDNEPTAEVSVTADSKPTPKSLPVLRFGREYRIRIRTVDIAGNSLPPDLPENDSVVSNAILYGRFEPLSSPVLVLRDYINEGESLETMVLRSNYNLSPLAYATSQSLVDALQIQKDNGKRHGDQDYHDTNERHIVPPQVSQQMVETCGTLDYAIIGGNDIKRAYHTSLRESGTLYDSEQVDLASGSLLPVPTAQPTVIAPVGQIPTNLKTLPRGEALGKNEYVIRKEEQIVLPFLPDPYVKGVAFKGLPGVSTQDVYFFKFEGTWPDIEPFRIKLVELPGAIGPYDNEPSMPPSRSGNVLTVHIPKGKRVKIRYSSFFDKDDVPKMGLYKWMDKKNQLALIDMIAAGQHWMFSPYRELSLVHAVQQPLYEPFFTTIKAARSHGRTDSTLEGVARVSVKSTAQLTVLAQWTEPVDDIAKEGPEVVDGSGTLNQMTIEKKSPDDFSITAAAPVQEFSDTKHRLVDYCLKGTTRFPEFFPKELTMYDNNISRTGGVASIHVPSTARPAMADIYSVIPAVKWYKATSPTSVTHTRYGNRLRVYVRRPWYSSGANEQLGVLFHTDSKPPYKAQKYATMIGSDPAFVSADPYQLSTASFPEAHFNGNSLHIEELGLSQEFSVAGHDVFFDERNSNPAERLWYSDIQLNVGHSYFPFVKLALARYQPYSLSGTELSPVSICQMVQILPDRKSLVKKISGTQFEIEISGHAPHKTFASAKAAQQSPLFPLIANPAGLNRLDIYVEYLPTGASDDLGWKVDTSATVSKHQDGPLVFSPIGATPELARLRRFTETEVLNVRTARASRETVFAATPAEMVEMQPGAISPVFQLPKLWNGTISFGKRRLNTSYRIVIKEYEYHLDDKNDATRRLVHADTVMLDEFVNPGN